MRVLAVVAVVLFQSCLSRCSDDGYVPLVKQQYAEKINNQIRAQITLELQASYLYQAYASYFDRADVALPGFKKFFLQASKEEKEHAQILIDYVNKRGGSLQFGDIKLLDVCDTIKDLSKTVDLSRRRQQTCICYFVSQKRQMLKTKPDPSCMNPRSDWRHGLMAMEDALLIERKVNSELLDLHDIASSGPTKDPHLTHTLEHIYLEEQVESIKKFGDYVAQLSRFTDDYRLGEYLFDKSLQ
ncbi:yolk ferritin-like [Haliotis cracherodii]|uniref:yolk ferritin-like n=1 Tax=Haliotis cracherodii TaxID=6455 RepID=UPI0039EAE805